MSESNSNLSPLQRLLDVAGAVIQEAKHHTEPGRGASLSEATDGLPPGLLQKLIALEEASGEAVITELKRIELQDDLLAERINKETVIKLLDLHFEADNPDKNSFHIEAKTTDYILRFFGEMFAIALGDAENYITSEMTLRGRGKEVTDRYELTIKKLFGLSPREKYDDLLRRSQAFASQTLKLLNNEADAPLLDDLKYAATSIVKIEVKAPVAFANQPDPHELLHLQAKRLAERVLRYLGEDVEHAIMTFSEDRSTFQELVDLAKELNEH
jgi:hypothetical protein